MFITMSRHFANRRSVFLAASALQAEGIRPTLLSVKNRLGGGSYSTIRRYLDELEAQWSKRDQRTPEDAPLGSCTVETPRHILEKSAELGRVLWAMVIHEANQQTQEAKDVAKNQLIVLSQALHLAEAEVQLRREAEATPSMNLIQPIDSLFQTLNNMGDARIKLTEVEARQLTDEVRYLRQQVCDYKAELIALKASPLKGNRLR